MALLWYYAQVRGNAGYVDIGWAGGVGLGVAVLALNAATPWYWRLLVAALAITWALRLGAYLWRRIDGQPEDGRYSSLKQAWGYRKNFYLFWFFQAQAALALLFAVPVYIALNNPAPNVIMGVVGIIVWLIAVVGEAVADKQLRQFKANPANHGKTCDVGLWRYSRHPNYFFEWLHWFSYVALSFGHPWWWVSGFGPLIMLLFLYRLTGIPYTEQQALRSRGADYRDYQRRTSAFFPWWPRRV